MRANGAQAGGVGGERRLDGRVDGERMWTASLAVTALQDGVGGFEEDQAGGDDPLDRLDDGREFLELAPFADVHDEGGAIDFGGLPGQFGKARDEADGEIVHAV